MRISTLSLAVIFFVGSGCLIQGRESRSLHTPEREHYSISWDNKCGDHVADIAFAPQTGVISWHPWLKTKDTSHPDNTAISSRYYRIERKDNTCAEIVVGLYAAEQRKGLRLMGRGKANLANGSFDLAASFLNTWDIKCSQWRGVEIELRGQGEDYAEDIELACDDTREHYVFIGLDRGASNKERSQGLAITTITVNKQEYEDEMKNLSPMEKLARVLSWKLHGQYNNYDVDSAGRLMKHVHIDGIKGTKEVVIDRYKK